MLLKLTQKVLKVLLIPLSLSIWIIPYLFGVRVLGIVYLRSIGHLLCEIDSLLKDVRLGNRAAYRWLVFFDSEEIANAAFTKLVPSELIKFISLPSFPKVILPALSQRVPLVPPKFGQYANAIYKITLLQLFQRPPLVLTKCEQYANAMYETASTFSINASWGDSEPLFSCPDSWKESRQDYFGRWGLPSDAKYVCLHLREDGSTSLGKPLHHYRNTSFKNYLDTIDYLAHQGFYTIRIGDHTMTPSPRHEYLFDYAITKDRQDWLDLAISADCTFFIGCSSGASWMASIFGRPVVSVNMCLPFAFSSTGAPRDLGIPKLFRRKDDDMLVTLSEVFDTGASEYRTNEEAYNSPYDLVPHTPEEILEVVQEMLLRVRGAWVESEEDIELQHKIHSFLKPGSYTHGTSSRCGAMFLRKYKSLLV